MSEDAAPAEPAPPQPEAPASPPAAKSSAKMTKRTLKERQVDKIASTEAAKAMMDRQQYEEMATAYHAKVDKARQRRSARTPSSKTTLTTPKTLAYSKDALISATTPKWKHTWDNSDPHQVADALKQLEDTNGACLQQDSNIFFNELGAKEKDEAMKSKLKKEQQESILMQSMAATAKEKNFMDKVYGQREDTQREMAMRLLEHECKSKQYMEDLERQRQTETDEKARQREARRHAAMKKSEEEAQAVAARKLELALAKEYKRRTLKGKECTMRAIEERSERNKTKSDTMRNRIDQVNEQQRLYREKIKSEVLAGLDRTSKQREQLVEKKVEHIRSKTNTKLEQHEQRLANIIQSDDQYRLEKYSKFLKQDEMLQQMKETKTAYQKEWLENARADIYDQFMKKEVLIDTLNCKKIRSEFAEMWLQSYPIPELRPKTAAV